MNDHARRAKRLRRLLHLRELEERVAKGRSDEALERAARADHVLATDRAAHASAADDLRARVAPGDLDAATLIGLERTLPALAARIARSRERSVSENQRADRARAEWLGARTARRGLERLVERVHVAARAEEERAEAARLDEVAVVRAWERRDRTSGPGDGASDPGNVGTDALPR